MRWINGGDMPLAANKSSVGFVNPPMIEYLYAAALWLWRDVLSVSLLTMLGGVVAVAVTGFVTARLFGRRAEEKATTMATTAILQTPEEEVD